MANRVAEVNRALAEKYGPGQIILTRGKGYYYYRGLIGWKLQSTYIYRADSWSVGSWLTEIDSLILESGQTPITFPRP